ncbi:MAG TPA: carbohydrate kinase family protein [Bacillales bacterium]|nr:carbohydrate kinase family protein [Bacillales bacterium]
MNPVGIIGNYNVDTVIGKVKEAPHWDAEIEAESFETRVAGTAGYMAIALHALGVKANIISSIGNDDQGKFLIRELETRGLATEGIVCVENTITPNGFVIVHENGSRAIVSVSGAHDAFGLSIYHAKKELLDVCDDVVICGTYLLPKFSPIEAVVVAKEQQSLGKRVYFDPSWDPSGWTEKRKSQTFHLLQFVDVFMPNETEICHLTNTSEWQKGLDIVKKYCGEVVVKLGANGAAVMKDGELIQVPPSHETDVVDTTGAGDIFDMGYLFARRQEKPLSNCLRFANEVSATVISSHNRKEGFRQLTKLKINN